MLKYAIIVAGGTGKRMGQALPKQFLKLGGVPILIHTLQAFYYADPQIKIILTLPEEEFQFWDDLNVWHNNYVDHQVIAGGKTRYHSVKNALAHVKGGLVAIHDGVRPFVKPDLILKSYELAEKNGNAIAAVSIKDSVRQIKAGENLNLNRSSLKAVQTPQTFKSDLIKKAFETDYRDDFTDDATVLEASGYPIFLFEGDYRNIKITTPEDLLIAEALLKTK